MLVSTPASRVQTNGTSRRGMAVSIRVAWASKIFLVCAAAFTALPAAFGAEQQKPAARREVERSRGVDGFQGAKFGMSIPQVRSAFPNAKVYDYPCKVRVAVLPGMLCEGLMVEDVNAGGLIWFAKFHFAESDRTLRVVSISTRTEQATVGNFDQLVRALASTYGVGKSSTLPDGPPCEELEREYKSNPFAFSQTRNQRLFTIDTAAGTATATFHEWHHCMHAPQAFGPGSISPALSVRYDAKDKVTPKGL